MPKPLTSRSINGGSRRLSSAFLDEEIRAVYESDVTHKPMEQTAREQAEVLIRFRGPLRPTLRAS